ncbi:hypothetical protein HDV00_006608 [Rhizophlyctis rosea]|nr:hypothetical protein HDV00_006608 [Rhizophlyctis rosea]
MTFTRNFATQGNVGDVVAKDDSQMSVAHLLGVLCGVGLLSVSHAPWFLFTSFFVLGPIHFAMTLALLDAARFEVLNQTKLTLISRKYIKEGVVPGMEDLKPHERIFGEWIRKGEDVPNLKVGVTVAKAFQSAADVEAAMDVLKNDNYLLSYDTPTRTISIVLHKSGGHKDIIKAILHSIKLDTEIRITYPSTTPTLADLQTALRSTHVWTKEKFPNFVTELDAKDWESDAVFWGDTGNRVEWEREVGEGEVGEGDEVRGDGGEVVGVKPKEE